ncbi:myrosinase 1-like [Thrips palmi]|uniref:Myrosinase 1-like n=1 Tax=Thrips palmi TaxID=161013 RepID=A0A6P9A4W7_THRPL|nr:myrosinase 1-like [Thrips palmi]
MFFSSLSVQFTSHRFSIAWSRVLPTGGTDNINQEGVKFYRDYIDKVISNGMEPMVTMLHMDHPVALEIATGGWDYPAMVEKFVVYAEFLFKTFGDKVKYWNTVNEPNMFCSYWPGLAPRENGFHRCVHNIIVAHMQAYQLYKQKYAPTQNGKVGASVLMSPGMPKTTQAEDVMAAEVFNQVYCGTVLHPLVYGDYPPVLRYLTDKLQKEKNVSEAILPTFTDEQKAILAGGATDFVALNLYSEFKAGYSNNPTNPNMPVLFKDMMEEIPFVEISGTGGFSKVDDALMKNGLLWIWRSYHIPIIIAENGLGDTKHAGVNDTERAAYHSANLRSLVRTIKEYGVEVLAYYAWALLDVYEFSAGYSGRPFGLIHVDYKTGSLNRTLKNSAQFFIELRDTGRVPNILPPDEGPSTSASSTLSSGLLLLAVGAMRGLWL